MKKIILNIIAIASLATTIQAQVSYKYYTINGDIHTLLGPTTQNYSSMQIYSSPNGGYVLPTALIVVDKYIHFSLANNIIPGFAFTNNTYCYQLQQEWFNIKQIGISKSKDFVATINTTTPNELSYTIQQSIDNGKTFFTSEAINIATKTIQVNQPIQTNTNAVQFVVTDKASGSRVYQSPMYYINVLATVYPTVTSTTCNVAFNAISGTYTIVNTLGASIANGSLQQYHNCVDVSMLVAGNYFIQIIDNVNNRSVTKQFQVIK